MPELSEQIDFIEFHESNKLNLTDSPDEITQEIDAILSTKKTVEEKLEALALFDNPAIEDYKQKLECEIIGDHLLKITEERIHSFVAIQQIATIKDLVKNVENQERLKEMADIYYTVRRRFEKFLHDLSNPLTALIGGLDLAKISKTKEEKQHFLDFALKSLKRVQETVQKNNPYDLSELLFIPDFVVMKKKQIESFIKEITILLENLENNIQTTHGLVNQKEAFEENIKLTFKSYNKLTNLLNHASKRKPNIIK